MENNKASLQETREDGRRARNHDVSTALNAMKQQITRSLGKLNNEFGKKLYLQIANREFVRHK